MVIKLIPHTLRTHTLKKWVNLGWKSLLASVVKGVSHRALGRKVTGVYRRFVCRSSQALIMELEVPARNALDSRTVKDKSPMRTSLCLHVY